MTGMGKSIIPRLAVLLVLVVSLACNLSTPLSSPVPTLPSLPNPSPTSPSLSSPTSPPAVPTDTTAPTAAVTPSTQAPSPSQAPGQVQIFLIALEDNGATGEPVGCGDSVVPVQREVTVSADPVLAALETLFSIKDQFYGESGLYNALYQSDLEVGSFSIDASGHATLNLTGAFLLGGVCDEPRFKAQIEATVLQFPEIQSVSIFLNGTPLEELLSNKI